MKSVQAKNTTSSAIDHSPFFSKESQGNFFGQSEKPSPFFNTNAIQAKLTVGASNDSYEKEADTTADTVVQRLANSEPPAKTFPSVQAKPLVPGITPLIQTKCAACEEEEKLQKKPIFESNAKLSDEEEHIQRKCAECEKEDEKKVQTKSESSSSQMASPSIEGSLNSSKGSGSPLPDNSRHQMESSFGSDFSNVRVHTDSSAIQMNRDLGAQAFTHGNDIYFNSGKYDTNSNAGKHLLAHELTHTVQQGSSAGMHAGSVQAKLEVNSQRLFEKEVHSAVPTSGREKPGDGGATPANPKDPTGKNKSAAAEPDGSKEANQSGGATTDVAGNNSVNGLATSKSESGQDKNRSEGEGANAPVTDPAVSAGDNNTATSSPANASSPGTSPAATSSPGNATSNATAPAPTTGASTAAGAQQNQPVANPAANKGGCTPKCYTGAKEEPAEEPETTPPDPDATKTEAEASKGDEEDLPEIDNCPTAQADAVVASADADSSSKATAPEAALMVGAPASSGKTNSKKANSPGSPGETNASKETPAQESGDALVGTSLDAIIVSAESQRNLAVAGYEGSSNALGMISPRTEILRRGVEAAGRAGENQARQEQRRLAATRADRFFSIIAGRLDSATAFAENDIPDQLGLTAESAKMQIGASMEAQKAAISTSIGQARGQAIAEAATTRAVVRAQAAAYMADVKSQTAAAIKSLTTTHATTMAQVNALETSTLDNINTVFASGRADLESLGTTIGAECTTKGEEFATLYKRFSNCTENGFWDGDLSGRRAEAQADAAKSVAKAYHDRMVDAAHKRAIEVTRNGRKTDRCSIIGAANQSRKTLDEQLPALVHAFEMTRDAAIQQAESAESSLIASINSSLTGTIRQLDKQEHDQRQAIDDSGYMQQVLQEQIVYAAAAAVQQGVRTAATSVQDAMLDIQARFASSEVPEPVMLDKALSKIEQNINVAMDGLTGSATTGARAAETQLADALQQGIASLEGITQSNEESTVALSSQFSTGMNGISGTDNFSTLRTTFTAQVQQSVNAAVAGLAQVMDGFKKSCDTTLKNAKTTLADAHKSLEQNLRQSQQGLECEMTHKADEAASKEAPAWKRVLAVVLVIIVIIIVVAVTVITAGAAGPLIVAALGGPLLAGAIIGAAVGAVVSGLIAMATNLWTNQSVMKGVGKAILVGAITGAAGGFIGAAAGAGAGAIFSASSKAVQTAAQFGAAMISAGGMDVVTQYVMGGFSFKHFSKGELGFTLLITALTFGLAHRVAARVPTAVPTEGGAPNAAAAESAIPEIPGASPAAEPQGSVPASSPESVPTPEPSGIAPAPEVPEPVPTAQTPEAPASSQVPEIPSASQTPEAVPPTETQKPAAANELPESAAANEIPEPVETAESSPNTNDPEEIGAGASPTEELKAPNLNKEEALEVLDKIQQSRREYYEAVLREAYDLPSTRPKTAASAGGETFASGQKGFEGFEHISPSEVKAAIGEGNFPEAKPGFLDQGEGGSYYASHGEPKAATANPNEPIGVSREMCQNCQIVMRQVATSRGIVQVVTDPAGTRIFYPNGAVDFIPW